LLRHAARGRERDAAGPGIIARRRRIGGRDPNALMPLDFLLERFHDLPATRSLIGRLPSPAKRSGVLGLPGSSAAVLVATAARALPQRGFTVVAPTPAAADRWLADLQTLRGPATRAPYPQPE